MLSRDEVDLNQLSFGINTNFVQFTLDESGFLPPGEFDPNINGTVQSDPGFNVDFGMSYNYLNFYAHLTVRNAIDSGNDIYSNIEDPNKRNFIINSGYVFGDAEKVLWEPSLMYQYSDATKESAIDINLKAYKQLEFGMLWGGLSYRSSFDTAEYTDSNGNVQTQNLQNITPIIGLNYKQFMFGYTYTYFMGDVNFDSAGFNQITLGFNFACRKERYHCDCPAVN
jgi:type IX secretion system PorP/SprF family membrane protein